MTDAYETKDLGEMDAPWGKKMILQELTFDGGFKMFRLRIKEGKRFTDLDLDGPTALRLGAKMANWGDEQPAE